MPCLRLSSLDTGKNAAICEYLSDGTLLCGTYQLQTEDGQGSHQTEQRTGGILTLSVENGLETRETLSTPGVLDIKPNQRMNTVAVMLADGTVDFYSIQSQENVMLLRKEQNVTVTDGICLAGAWR